MARLDQSNEKLVRLVSEQRTEIRGLRDGMRTVARGPTPDNMRPPSMTLLADSRLLRDVNEDMSTGGNDKIIIRRKSGATLDDIGDMIKEVRRTGTLRRDENRDRGRHP